MGNRLKWRPPSSPVVPRGGAARESQGIPLARQAGSCRRAGPVPSWALLRSALGSSAMLFPAGRRLLLRALASASRGPARHYAEAAAAPSAGPAQMAFTFASPSQVFYNAAHVKQVDVPTLSGSFGILAAHVPTLQVLKPGVVTVFAEDGSSSKYFVSSGSITVNADSSVQLLAEEVALLDQLDVTVAKSNLEKALSEVAAASDEAAKAEAQIRVEANEAIVKALE